MGLFSWLRPSKSPSAIAPSDQYPTCVAALNALIGIVVADQNQEKWATLNARGSAGKATIQVNIDEVNCLLHEIDLPAFLIRHGQPALAARAQPKDQDMTYWRITDGTVSELTTIVDLLFIHELGLGPQYTVQGVIEC
jgi:hypothetical protein